MERLALLRVLFPSFAPNIGACALVGMGAYFAAVISAPITSILMIFELTRDYNIIIPLMIANVISYFIAEKIHKGSIYENICEQDGIHLPGKEDHETLDSMAVEDAMVTEIFSLDAGKKLDECIKDLSSFDPKVSGYPIKRNNSLVGIISKK